MNDIILESISDGVFTVNLNWEITSFNRAAEKITGIKRADAMGKPCCEVFKSNMCENECPLRKTMRNGKPVINAEGYIITLAGHTVPVSVSTALLKDTKGKILGGAETFRDLSEIEELRNELKIKSGQGKFSSSSPSMKKILEILPVIADSPSTVLIKGETGTGKEVLARYIHTQSGRAKKQFIAINCGALPDTLLESELFGYKKGAFTGADKDKLGRFALAEGGTLFLDEIGDITPAMQVKLLRVLQEREYEPLGSIQTLKTNVRIICASNKNLKDLVRQGLFRQDLYFRINIVALELPPLRFRREDIPNLSERFLQKYNLLMGKSINGFSPDAYKIISAYSWPGNIRELENVIERAVLLCREKTIKPECLPSDLFGAALPEKDISGIRETKQDAEKQSIVSVMENNGYDRIKTAEILGIDKATLYRKIKKYGITLPGKIK